MGVMTDHKKHLQELAEMVQQLSCGDDEQLQKFLAKLKYAIRDIFGEASPYLDYLVNIRFKPASFFASDSEHARSWQNGQQQVDTLLTNMMQDPLLTGGKEKKSAGTHNPEYDSTFKKLQQAPMDRSSWKDLQQLEELKRSVLDQIEQFKDDVLGTLELSDIVRNPPVIRPAAVPEKSPAEESIKPFINEKASSRIFLVNGGNDYVNIEVASFLQKLGFELVISGSNFYSSSSIIEDFRKCAIFDFAVVLLSADLITFPKSQRPQDGWLISQPSLVFQLGYLIGQLGKNRVLVIHEEIKNYKCPTGYFEIFYAPYDAAKGWHEEVRRRMKACGMILK